MSYQHGDVRIEEKPDYYDPEDTPTPHDARRRENSPKAWPFVALPHSCDAWVIGGPDEIDQMIADLTAAKLELLRLRRRA